jgi:hypothetical protein
MYRDRRYTPERARRLLLRAAARSKGDGPTGETRTIEQLEALAASLGIDPKLVREAVEEGEQPAPPKGVFDRLRGGPRRIVMERVIDRPLADSEQLRVVDALRTAFDDVGRTEVLPGQITWSPKTPNRALSVTVTVEGDRTRVRFDENLANLAGGLFGGLVGGLGGGVVAPITTTAARLLGPTFPIAAFLAAFAWFAAVYALARWLFVTRSQKRHDDLELAAEKIVAALEQPAEALAPAPRLRVGPHLDPVTVQPPPQRNSDLDLEVERDLVAGIEADAADRAARANRSRA